MRKINKGANINRDIKKERDFVWWVHTALFNSQCWIWICAQGVTPSHAQKTICITRVQAEMACIASKKVLSTSVLSPVIKKKDFKGLAHTISKTGKWLWATAKIQAKILLNIKAVNKKLYCIFVLKTFSWLDEFWPHFGEQLAKFTSIDEYLCQILEGIF